jgi:hypothetical protein
MHRHSAQHRLIEQQLQALQQREVSVGYDDVFGGGDDRVSHGNALFAGGHGSGSGEGGGGGGGGGGGKKGKGWRQRAVTDQPSRNSQEGIALGDVFGGGDADSGVTRSGRGMTWFGHGSTAAKGGEDEEADRMTLGSQFGDTPSILGEWQGQSVNPMREAALSAAADAADDEVGVRGRAVSGGWNRNFTVASIEEWEGEYSLASNPLALALNGARTASTSD